METVLHFERVCTLPMLRAKVDGVEGYLALDTGSQHSTMNSTYFGQTQKTAETATVMKTGVQDVQDEGKHLFEEISFGSITLCSQERTLLDMTYVEKPLRTQAPDFVFLGTVGMEFWGDHRLLLDMPAGIAVLEPENDFAHADVAELTLRRGVACVEGRINNEVLRLIVDSCASQGVLSVEAARRIGLAEDAKGPQSLPTLTIGQTSFANLHTMVCDMKPLQAKIPQLDGILPVTALSTQRTLLDFPNNLILFERL